MGLDVGVVKITYLDRPKEPSYHFLWWLASEAGHDDWGGAWEGNAFVEMPRRRMLSKARAYARQEQVPQESLDKLITWVRELPWDESTIMLHLNW